MSPGRRETDVAEQHFLQPLGIDAPFARVELFVSNGSADAPARLALSQRPVQNRIASTVELTHDALCFERVSGATTTFHVRGETAEGPLDWRFAWPEPVSPDRELQITIGLYREPSRPVLVGAVAR